VFIASFLCSIPYWRCYVTSKNAVGDTLRATYDQLSRDPNSLANLDQDLPNYAQHQVPIFSLPQEWLWCESWCSDDSKEAVRGVCCCCCCCCCMCMYICKCIVVLLLFLYICFVGVSFFYLPCFGCNCTYLSNFPVHLFAGASVGACVCVCGGSRPRPLTCATTPFTRSRSWRWRGAWCPGRCSTSHGWSWTRRSGSCSSAAEYWLSMAYATSFSSWKL
jgi:hypothetical protein